MSGRGKRSARGEAAGRRATICCYLLLRIDGGPSGAVAQHFAVSYFPNTIICFFLLFDLQLWTFILKMRDFSIPGVVLDSLEADLLCFLGFKDSRFRI